MDILIMIVCAVISIGFLVFIHEGGHYLAARALSLIHIFRGGTAVSGAWPKCAGGFPTKRRGIEPERRASECAEATMVAVCVRKSAEACQLRVGRRLLTG